MPEETQPDLSNWNDFLGKFFKVDHVKTWPAVVIATGLTGSIDDEGEAHVVYDVEYNTRKLKFEPNKTNIGIIRNAGIVSPRALIGKKITFRQVMNFNPQIKKKVPSLEIDKVE